jgi:hypothetical protein
VAEWPADPPVRTVMLRDRAPAWPCTLKREVRTGNGQEKEQPFADHSKHNFQMSRTLTAGSAALVNDMSVAAASDEDTGKRVSRQKKTADNTNTQSPVSRAMKTKVTHARASRVADRVALRAFACATVSTQGGGDRARAKHPNIVKRLWLTARPTRPSRRGRGPT